MTMRMMIMNAVLLVLLMAAGCSEVAITGRSQLNLIPDDTINSMATQEYNTFLKENKVTADTEKIDQVKRVGYRLVEAVETYCAQNRMTSAIEGFSWEFNVVENEQVNAWCMPGGKVVVYTGILPITQNDEGLAVVMGHEIAHAIARHGSERMSQGLLVQMGGIALSEAVSSQPAATQELFMRSFGIGTEVGILLPYSRTHEKEADRMGLIFMAMAGYDPRVSVDFWKRMAAGKQGEAPPEFLSTHPADATRIAYLQEMIPEALRYYTPR